ncbi:MAG: hypothetical protein OXJ90_21085 [Spirochaetaceae bacterium]|nr:hypothetical protein [Spirochaetaceae bacterium]
MAFLRPVTWKPGQRAMEPDTYDATIGSLHGWYEGRPAPVDEGMRRFPHMRLIGRATSTDFVRWTPTGTVMVPDEDDPDGVELYSMPVFIYQGAGTWACCTCSTATRMSPRSARRGSWTSSSRPAGTASRGVASGATGP